MKKWILPILLMVGVVQAQQMPYLVGSLKNRADGRIYFTSDRGNCKDSFFVFIRGDGGKLEDRGCYVFGDQFIVVTWNAGDVYTYSYDSLLFTKEMQDYIAGQK